MSNPSFSAETGVTLLADLRERPSLLLWELAWRWSCGAVLLFVAGYDAVHIWAHTQAALRATGIFSLSGDSLLSDPSQLSTAVQAALAILRPQVERAVAGLAPLGIFCWVAAFGLGRAWVMARYDGRLAGRAWPLAEREAIRIVGLLGASILWSFLLHVAAAVALNGAAPHVLLYVFVVLLLTGAALLAWRKLAQTVELAMAICLSESLSLRAAFRLAWTGGPAAATPQVRRVRKSAKRSRFFFFGGAVALSLFPAPLAGLWALAAWWCAVSLLTLAAADALRLGVQFAFLRALREHRFARLASSLPATRL